MLLRLFWVCCCYHCRDSLLSFSTMRCVASLCAASLPMVACFAFHPASTHHSGMTTRTPPHTRARLFSSGSKNHNTQEGHLEFRGSCNRSSGGGGRGRSRMRRFAAGKGGGPLNMDPSDDIPEAGGEGDAELYASLRRRLEELEKSSPVAGPGQQQQQQQLEQQQPPLPSPARAREREFTVPREATQDRARSRALLTIQSVGVISAALSLGTLVLYWLAGAYFVHLGPREYPGSVSARQGTTRMMSGEERGPAGESTPRRTMGESSTREAFQFQGFPDTVVKDVVPPDF